MARKRKPQSVDYVVAGKGRRVLNLLIDSVCFWALWFVVLAVLPSDVRIGVLEGLSGALFSLTIMLAYYVGFEATLGRTPAKFLTGTKVVAIDGGRPRLKQILGRTLARLVPFEAFSFFGKSDGWHDRWSDTRVVRTQVSVPDEPISPAEWVTDPRLAAGRVRVVVSGNPVDYRVADPSQRRVVCGVCEEEFSYGRSSCPRCEAQYRYVGGRAELYE